MVNILEKYHLQWPIVFRLQNCVATHLKRQNKLLCVLFSDLTLALTAKHDKLYELNHVEDLHVHNHLSSLNIMAMNYSIY